MIRFSALLFPIAILALVLAACGGAPEPKLNSISAPSSSASVETPEPTNVPDGPEATLEKPSSVVEEPTSTVLEALTPEPTPTETEAATQDESAVDSGLAIDPSELLAQAMNSTEMMSCLSGRVGMAALMRMASSEPTAEEMSLALSCFNDAGTIEIESSNATTSTGTNSGTTSDGGTSADPETLLAQALASPGLMWCLADKIGLETVIQSTDREPTKAENFQIQSCLSDKQEIAAWDAEWPKRVDAAFAATECGVPPVTNYPASYCQGPFIDTHLHLPQLPDHSVSGPVDDGYVQPRGAESDQYDIPEEQRPLMGTNATVGKAACTLQNEGTIKAFTFFPTFPEITSPAIDVAYRAVQEYPSLFVPFLQASANGSSTLVGESLDAMLDVHPNFFFGFGEVGDSPTEPINPTPDSEDYTGDFEVARDHGVVVWFHVGEGHEENMARALARFPDVRFIVHGDGVRPFIDGLMDDYPNIYFTFNNIFQNMVPVFRFGTKADFISGMREDWSGLPEAALEEFRPLIEDHPDRCVWGTDRGDIVWGYDEEVGQLLTEYARAFIGNFDPETQDLIAYKNAERLIGDYGKP